MVRSNGTLASSNYAQGFIQDTVYELSVSAATPDWCKDTAVEYARDKETVSEILAPAHHPEFVSHVNSGVRS